MFWESGTACCVDTESSYHKPHVLSSARGSYQWYRRQERWYYAATCKFFFAPFVLWKTILYFKHNVRSAYDANGKMFHVEHFVNKHNGYSGNAVWSEHHVGYVIYDIQTFLWKCKKKGKNTARQKNATIRIKTLLQVRQIVDRESEWSNIPRHLFPCARYVQQCRRGVPGIMPDPRCYKTGEYLWE